MQNELRRLNELEMLVGKTPMAEITYRFKKAVKKLYVKLEFYNFSGSIKDRMAFNCLKKAYENGSLKPGYIIAETTSGNTGIALCSMGSYLGHTCVIFMPDWMSEERKSIISSFGAELILVSRDEGGFLGCLEKTKEFGKKEGVYLPDQFANKYNIDAHYITTGPEILKQTSKFGAKIHGVALGVGTGGTLMGVGRFLRSVDKNIKMFPMEPSSSPTMTTGYQIGTHRIAGISDEFIPQIMNLEECDEILQVDDVDAIIMAQRISKELGLGVGISSGANFLAAILASEKTFEGANIVTVFSDDNKKYLSTDYAKEEPVKDYYISPMIEFLDISFVDA